MSGLLMTYSKKILHDGLAGRTLNIPAGLLLLAMFLLLSGCVNMPVEQAAPQQQVPVVAPEVMSKYQSALRLMELGTI